MANAVPELGGGHIIIDVVLPVPLGVIGVDAVSSGRVGYESLGVEDGDSRGTMQQTSMPVHLSLIRFNQSIRLIVPRHDEDDLDDVFPKSNMA